MQSDDPTRTGPQVSIVKETPATRALASWGIPYALHPGIDDTTSDDAVRPVGLPERRTFKTLLVMAGDDPVAATVPRASELDLPALAAAIGHHHAVLADAEQITRMSKSPPDCVSPLGLETMTWSVLDVSAMIYPSILIASGIPGLDIEVIPQNLVNVLDARLAPIADFRSTPV